MIASVSGEVLDIALDHVVIEAGGIGYKLHVTPATLAGLSRGMTTRLITAMIVREDSMTLYGFADGEAKNLFNLLLTVSGVGPRIAMATLAVYEPQDLCKALSEGNVAALTRIPGIGKRGAERLVVELRDKVASLPSSGGSAGTTSPLSPLRDQVIEALVGLGFALKQAEQAIDSVLTQTPDGTSSELLRSALTLLGKTR